MQPLTAAPREHLTDAEVFDLLTGDEVTVSAGLELLDSSNRYIDDITEDLIAEGSSIDHDGRAKVHGSCSLKLQRPLVWGRDRVRPYMTLSNAAVEARFYLGVYVLTTPQRKEGEQDEAGRRLVTYDVTGYDLLSRLNEPVGDTYVVIPDEGDDVVANGGFEAGIDGWESNPAFGIFTPATVASSTSHPSAGSKSLAITWPTASLSWANTHASTFIPGKTYRFEADVWVPLDGPDEFRFDVAFWAYSPWFSVTKGASNHLEWLWTATRADGFIGLTSHSTTAGQTSYLDEFHVVALSTTCLDAVKAAISLAGVGAPLRLDGTQQVAVMPRPMVWVLTEGSDVTWLSIINDMLDAVNYRPLWVDETGTFRSEPYLDPRQQPVEWTFDVEDLATTIVGPERVYDEDTWGRPNWWRFIRRGMETRPVEGDGIYTVLNLDRGPSSQQALGFEVRATPRFVDAVDQATLVAYGDRVVTEDTTITRTATLQVEPMPIAGHLDVVQLIDGVVKARAQVTSWQLRLDGAPGPWVLEVVD